MVQLIVGKKGKGKQTAVRQSKCRGKNANGNIVYIDKSTKHMFELNNKSTSDFRNRLSSEKQ